MRSNFFRKDSFISSCAEFRHFWRKEKSRNNRNTNTLRKFLFINTFEMRGLFPHTFPSPIFKKTYSSCVDKFSSIPITDDRDKYVSRHRRFSGARGRKQPLARLHTSSRPLVGEKNWWMMALDVVRRKLRRILRRRKGKQGGVFARADGKGGCAKEGGRAVGLHGISAYIIVSRRA